MFFNISYLHDFFPQMDIAFWNVFFFFNQTKQHFKKQSPPAMNACLPSIWWVSCLLVLCSRCCCMKFVCPTYIVIYPQSDWFPQKKKNWSVRENKQSCSHHTQRWTLSVEGGRENSDSIHAQWWCGGGAGCVRVPASASAIFLFPPDLLPPPPVLLPPWAPFIPP